MSRRVNRRRFLQASGVSAAAAGFWLTGGVTESFAAQPGPNERLNIAIVGCGGQGGGNANQAAIRGENIVALCDVDQNRARGVFDKYPNVTKYTDFRVMLEKQKDIQAVVVSTPDHTHFHASAMALQPKPNRTPRASIALMLLLAYEVMLKLPARDVNRKPRRFQNIGK